MSASDKAPTPKSPAADPATKQLRSPHASAPQPDRRPAAAVQRQAQQAIDSSPRVQQSATLQRALNSRAQATGPAAPAQRQEATAPVRENNTGLPDELKAGVENLSGHSLDDVRVHYNSAQPAELQAHAYAQGTDIHVAPGQEQHLPHEAWHVAQQKQGRVKPTMQMKGKVNVNDDAGLEHEADAMGAKALQSAQLKSSEDEEDLLQAKPAGSAATVAQAAQVAQRTVWEWSEEQRYWKAVRTEGAPTARPTAVGKYDTERISTGREDAYGEAAEATAAEPTAFSIAFDSGHGDLHFNGEPTEKKSKWYASIGKGGAQALMETEIRARMADIVAAATSAHAAKKDLAWILVADSPTPIGKAVGVGAISRFQIQLQVPKGSTQITYHGFPDEQALHTGLGVGRNNLT
jgi:hypothetical protein